MNRKPKRLIMAPCEKGGGGKSQWIKTFADIARWKGHAVALFDGDKSVSTLFRFMCQRVNGKPAEHQDPLTGVVSYNMRSELEREQFGNSMQTAADVLVHDVPGGAALDLARIIDDGRGEAVDGLFDLIEDQGYRATLVHLVTPDLSSVSSVEKYRSMIGDRADHVAVVNRSFGVDDSDFPWWFGFRNMEGKDVGGKARSRFIEAGGIEINMPALRRGPAVKLDSENLRFTQAIESQNLKLVEQAQVRNYLKQFEAELEKVQHWIFP